MKPEVQLPTLPLPDYDDGELVEGQKYWDENSMRYYGEMCWHAAKVEAENEIQMWRAIALEAGKAGVKVGYGIINHQVNQAT